MNASVVATNFSGSLCGLVLIQFAEADFAAGNSPQCSARVGDKAIELVIDAYNRQPRCLNLMLSLVPFQSGPIFEALAGPFVAAQPFTTTVMVPSTTVPGGSFQMVLTWNGQMGWGNGFWTIPESPSAPPVAPTSLHVSHS
jgi:hypothetical protein